MMIAMGIGDEAGERLENQLAATLELEWRHIEMRTVKVGDEPARNFTDVSDAAFDLALRKLGLADIQVHCFGSAIMNWSKTIGDSFAPTVEEVRRAIPRMKRSGARFIRIMSYKPGDDEFRIPAEVFRRVKDVTNRFLDEGLVPVHENCMNYGGMSWQHALEVLDKCPGLRWAFDTGNPLVNADRSKPKPWPMQDPWEFWENIREHVAHIHVKDLVPGAVPGRVDYTWPGEGIARVADILRNASDRGYSGGLSIEPHMISVFHDPKNDPAPADPRSSEKRANFVEYGRRLWRLSTPK